MFSQFNATVSNDTKFTSQSSVTEIVKAISGKKRTYYSVEDWQIYCLGLKSAQLQVFAVVWSFCKGNPDESSFFGGNSKLAELTGFSLPTVKRAVKDLLGNTHLLTVEYWYDRKGIKRLALKPNYQVVAAAFNDSKLPKSVQCENPYNCPECENNTDCIGINMIGRGITVTPSYKEDKKLDKNNSCCNARVPTSTPQSKKFEPKYPRYQATQKPTQSEVRSYLATQGFEREAKTIAKQLEAQNWKDANENPIHAWKQFVLAWAKNLRVKDKVQSAANRQNGTARTTSKSNAVNDKITALKTHYKQLKTEQLAAIFLNTADKLSAEVEFAVKEIYSRFEAGLVTNEQLKRLGVCFDVDF